MSDSKTPQSFLRTYWNYWVNINEYLKLLTAILLGIFFLLIIQNLIDKPTKELKIAKDGVEITLPSGEAVKLTRCGTPGQRECAIFNKEFTNSKNSRILNNTNYSMIVSEHEGNSVDCCYTFTGAITFDYCYKFKTLDQCPSGWWEEN